MNPALAEIETFSAALAPSQSSAANPDHFEKHARRQSLARFLARYELFKRQLEIEGCIVECGVHHGSGLMAWAKLSAAFEPYALHRKIFGFDTFCGFPSLSPQDQPVESHEQARSGGFATNYDVYAELEKLIHEYDKNRPLGEHRKVFLIRGDAVITIPEFLQQHPYVLVSLLFLDFDLYEPTKTALQHFLPRMSKGAILAFDEINKAKWPGETAALLEALDLRNYQIHRFTFDPNISYIVL